MMDPKFIKRRAEECEAYEAQEVLMERLAQLNKMERALMPTDIDEPLEARILNVAKDAENEAEALAALTSVIIMCATAGGWDKASSLASISAQWDRMEENMLPKLRKALERE